MLYPENRQLPQVLTEPSFIKRKLVEGDILLPRVFKAYGCGTYSGEYADCYPAQHVLVIRSNNPLTQRYLAAFLRSDVAERAILDISKPTKHFGMKMIKITDLRKIAIPSLTRKAMQSVIEKDQDNQDRLLTENYPRREISFQKDQTVTTEDYEAVESVRPKDLARMIQNTRKFLRAAGEAGMTVSIGHNTVCAGKGHTLFVTSKDTCVVENNDTGGILTFRGDTLLWEKGITSADVEKFEELARISVFDTHLLSRNEDGSRNATKQGLEY